MKYDGIQSSDGHFVALCGKLDPVPIGEVRGYATSRFLSLSYSSTEVQ